MAAFFLFRVHFAPQPGATAMGGVVCVVAIDATGAIATAVQHRGAGEWVEVFAVERLFPVDAIASSVQLELRMRAASAAAEVQ